MPEQPVLKWWHVAVAVILVAVGYGSLLTDVGNLKERVTTLEGRTDNVKQLRTGKGDLCLKILEEWGKLKDAKRQESLMFRWSAADCDAGVPAGMIIPANMAENLGHEL